MDPAGPGAPSGEVVPPAGGTLIEDVGDLFVSTDPCLPQESRWWQPAEQDYIALGKSIPLEHLHFDTDVRAGQIRKLRAKKIEEIVLSFRNNPPVGELGGVLVVPRRADEETGYFVLGHQHAVAALQEWRRQRLEEGLQPLPCMQTVSCDVVRFSLSTHQRQMLAGGNQLAQETSDPLLLSEKMVLFRRASNPKNMSFEDRVLSGIQKAAIGRTENLVCSPSASIAGCLCSLASSHLFASQAVQPLHPW